jgi:hypothetical protein
LFPVPALVASATIIPLAAPLAGSKWIVPLFNRKVPWTVCRDALSVNSILVCAGSSSTVTCCASSLSALAGKRKVETAIRMYFDKVLST